MSFARARGDAECGRKRKRPQSPTARVAADILVWHLWVRPEARGRGWARRLIEAVVSVAADACGHGEPHFGFCVRLSADVLQFNRKGLAFWRHLLREGREEHVTEDIRRSSVLWTDAWEVKLWTSNK